VDEDEPDDVRDATADESEEPEEDDAAAGVVDRAYESRSAR
jgi:hypothetical protein